MVLRSKYPINVINPFQVETNTSTLPPPGKPVDPTRDIETLVEDDSNLNNREDVVSRADTEDEGPQLGSVFPAATRSVRRFLVLGLFLI